MVILLLVFHVLDPESILSGVLVYFLCSVADPTICEEHSMRMPGMLPCIAMAQAEMAAAIRPGMQVVRWQCSSREPDPRENSGIPVDWHADTVTRP
jgi:hypothetical protein